MNQQEYCANMNHTHKDGTYVAHINDSGYVELFHGRNPTSLWQAIDDFPFGTAELTGVRLVGLLTPFS